MKVGRLFTQRLANPTDILSLDDDLSRARMILPSLPVSRRGEASAWLRREGKLELTEETRLAQP